MAPTITSHHTGYKGSKSYHSQHLLWLTLILWWALCLENSGQLCCTWVLPKIGEGRNKGVGRVKINSFLHLPDPSQRKRGPAGAVRHGSSLATGSQWQYSFLSGLTAHFLEFQLPGPSLFYILNMKSLGHFPTLIVPYWYRLFPYWTTDRALQSSLL